jgi:hypothetical protein
MASVFFERIVLSGVFDRRRRRFASLYDEFAVELEGSTAARDHRRAARIADA